MKTATVNLGGQHFQAMPLSVAETTRAARALAVMGKASEDNLYNGIVAAIEDLTDVLLNSLQKVNPQMTWQQLQEMATPNDVLLALGVLIPASLDPSTLAGELLSMYQSRGPGEN